VNKINTPQITFIIKKIIKTLYWVLPILIFTVIFVKIDFNAFKKNISQTNPWLLVAGIFYYPFVILIGGLRWRVIVNYYYKNKPPYWFMLRHYWIGLALGIFAPGMIGWDVYRIIVMGKKFGNYLENIGAIIIEKIMALLNVTLMIVVLYPFVKNLVVNDTIIFHELLNAAHIALLISLVTILFLFIVPFNKYSSTLVVKLQNRVSYYYNKVRRVVGFDYPISNSTPNMADIIKPIFRPRAFCLVFTLSLGIQIISAIGNQMFFRALGYDLPFIVNIFVLPIFYFIFLLPISFGSLGIREGAYILIYGLFGVPAETALLVSFFNLMGILFNNAIGGLLIWTKSSRERTHHLSKARSTQQTLHVSDS